MAITGDALDVILRVQNLRAFQRGMKTAAGEVRAVGAAAKETDAEMAAMGKGTGAFAAITKASKWGAAGLAALGVEAYRLNVNFSRDMTQVQTMAGASSAELVRMRKAVLGLGGHLTQTPDELAKGLYHLESVGLRGSAALDALKAASVGATMGNANLEETATALGSALMVRMTGGAKTATGVMAQLTAIAGAGNMTMQDLVYALGNNILPAAKVAGISLQNVGAAIALLTDEGMPASSAAAQLGTALHFLYAPTDKAKNALDSLGLTQADLVNQLQGKDGLMGALDLINKRLDTYAGSDRAKRLDLLGQILPGGRGRVLISLMNQIDRYRQKLVQVHNTTGDFDKHAAQAQDTAAARLHRAWSGIEADLIRLSDLYQGPATSAIEFLINYGVRPLIDILAAVPGAIQGTIDFYNKLPGPIKFVVDAIGLLVAEITIYMAVAKGITLVNALAAASYGFLAGAAETAAIAMLIALDNPILLGIAALILVLALLITHWKQVKHWASDAFHWVSAHWPLLVPIMMVLFGPLGILIGLLAAVATHWKQVKHAGQDAAHWIKTAWDNSIHFIANRLRDFWKFVKNIFGKVKGPLKWMFDHTPAGMANKVLKAVHLPHLPFAQGTMNAPGGLSLVGERGPELVNLPRGASVIPTGQSYFEPRRHLPNPAPAGGGGGVEEHHNHVYLFKGGREIATIVNRFNADRRSRA